MINIIFNYVSRLQGKLFFLKVNRTIYFENGPWKVKSEITI